MCIKLLTGSSFFYLLVILQNNSNRGLPSTVIQNHAESISPAAVLRRKPRVRVHRNETTQLTNVHSIAEIFHCDDYDW